MLINVALSENIPEPLTYRIPGDRNDIKAGMRVIVPLGKRITSGWVVGGESRYSGPAKAILGIVHDRYFPDDGYLEFIREVAGTHFISMGTLLDHSLSPKRKPIQNLRYESDGKWLKLKDATLSGLIPVTMKQPLDFHHPFDEDREEPPAGDNRISAETNGNLLILSHERYPHYRELFEKCTRSGKSIILAIPDLLTAQYWKNRFPDLLLYTSATKPLLREQLWNDLQAGESRFIVGGLTAIFLPAANLGCIIVDRFGSGLYQPTAYSPLNVRRVAQIRARTCSIPLVEGHSSHSVDSYLHRDQVSIRDDRDSGKSSVEVRRVKKGEKGIPPELIELVKTQYLAKRKIWIVLNRGKGSGYLFCPECKRIEKCPSCGGNLQVEEDFSVSCRSCAYRHSQMRLCSRCQKELSLNREMDLESIHMAIRRTIAEEGVCSMIPEKKEEWPGAAAQAAGCTILLSTLRAVNPLFRAIFDCIIYVRPESLFNMNRFNSAEMIVSTVSEMRGLVKENGQVFVFSSYHFHYALQLVDRETDFFERELKYRSWFLLPPYFNVYLLELKNADLRSLAKKMREIFGKLRKELNIKRIYLASRFKIRGAYRGGMELHCSAEDLRRSGLHKMPGASVSLFGE